jgi:hypothetical protein
VAKGVLIVESVPSTPDRVDEYNRWYTEVHIPEVCSLPGFVGATRYEPVDADAPYVALYELDLDDLASAMTLLGEAVGRGEIHMSDAICLDPPPTVRLMSLGTRHESATARA